MNNTLTLTQGVRSGFAWPIVDTAGAPATLTGYTARAQVREQEHADSTLLATLTAEISGSSVVVSWGDVESRAWSFANGFMDVILRDETGEGRVIVWQGQVHVDQVITDRG